jgi:AraC-like DNA-binding protein
VVKLSGDPGLALRLGHHIDMASLGTYGFAIMSSADIRAATALSLRYSKVVEPGSHWTVIEQDKGLLLRLQQTFGTRAQQQLVAELDFSNKYSVAAFLTDASPEGIELQFNYPKPAHYASYKEYLPIPIAFDQEYSQVFLPDEWLNQPVKTANPAGNVVFTQQCEEMLRDLNRVENTSAAIRRLLIRSSGVMPNILQVADHLHVTERTLRRRLVTESTSFRTICDEVRNVLAQKYLSSTSLKVNEIANLLNYSEPANFRRAFLRWNAMTASEYRKRAT